MKFSRKQTLNKSEGLINDCQLVLEPNQCQHQALISRDSMNSFNMMNFIKLI